MIYDNFKEKLDKLKTVLSVIKRYRVLILSVLTLIIAVTTVLLSTNGMIYGDGRCASVAVYGEKVEYRAHAFMSEVSYQYSPASVDEWSYEYPLYPGQYKVRAVAKGSFGSKHYGKEQTFEILAKEIQTTVAETEIRYGDTPTLTAAFVKGDFAQCDTFEYTGLGTEQVYVEPALEKIKIFNASGMDVSVCYHITTAQTEISLTQRELQITVESASKVYDGQPLTSENFTIGENTPLVTGDRIVTTFSESVISVGEEVDNLVDVQIFNSEEVDVTPYYSINKTIGKLKVEKRPLLLETVSDSKVYDGKPLENLTYTISDETSLLEGHEIQINAGAQLTFVGSRQNTLDVTIFDENGNDVTANYDVSFPEDSVLTVTKRPVALISENFTRIYDATPLVYETFATENVVEGERVVASFTGEITDKGETENSFTATIFNVDDVDVTDCYEITYTYGSLTIMPRPITVLTHTHEWIYDGTAQSDNDECERGGYTSADVIGEYGLVSDHRLYVKIATASITNVWEGNVTNELEVGVYSSNTATAGDVNENYEISYEYGSLTVTPRPITVLTHTHEWMYDGTAQSDGDDCEYGGYTSADVIDEYYGLVNDHGLRITTKELPSVTNVKDGKVENVLEVKVYSDTETTGDVNENYEITYEYGGVSITPRPIMVVTHDQEWTYDGKEHFDECDYSEEDLLFEDGKYFDLVLDHTLNVETRTKVVNVWDSVENNNAMTFSIQSEEGDVTENYAISYTYGNLTITPRPIMIVTHDHEWTYDGEEHFDECSYAESALKIEKEKYFDLVLDHTLNVETRAKVVNVWDSVENNNAMTFSLQSEEGDVTENYAISYTYGSLTITPRPITVLTHTHEWIYDGTAQSDNDECERGGYTSADVIGEYGLVSDHKLYVKIATASITNVWEGNVTNELEVGVYSSNTATAGDVNENYEISYEYGSLTVTPRPITVLTHTHEWMYDGTAQSDGDDCEYGGYTSADVIDGYYGLVNDHGLQITTKELPSVTNVKDGKVENVLEVKVYSDTESDVSKNYEISYEYGTIEIVPRSVYVLTHSHDWMYDGEEHFDDCEYSEEDLLFEGGKYFDLVLDHKLVVNKETATRVKTVLDWTVGNNVLEFTIVGQEGDVTENYAFSFLYGTLKIRPRPICITTHDHEWMYDGKDHFDECAYTNDDLFVDGSEYFELVGNDQVKKSAVVSVRNVSDSIANNNDITFTVESLAEGDVTYNYAIHVNKGTLTITPRPIKVLTHSHTWVYRGNEPFYDDADCDEGYGAKDLFLGAETDLNGDTVRYLPLVDGHQLVIEGVRYIEYVGTTENTLTFNVVDGNGESELENYTISYGYGTLEVVPRPVYIGTLNHTWEYDGLAHCEPEEYYGSESLLAKEVGGITAYTELGSGDRIVIGEKTFIAADDLSEKGVPNALTFLFQRTEGETDVAANYVLLGVENGTLRIVPRMVTIAPKSDSKAYDGKPLEALPGEYVVKKGTVLEGHELTVSTKGAYLDGNVGKVEHLFADDPNATVMSGDTDVTRFYEIVYAEDPGILEIFSKKLTIYSASDIKYYDGTPLTNTTYENSALVEGHTLTVEITGSQTEVGESDNTISDYHIYDEKGNDITDSGLYKVVLRPGLLIVRAPNEDEDSGNDDGGGRGGFNFSGDINSSGSSGNTPSNGGGGGTPLFWVTAEQTGIMYIRQESYGDYYLSGWADVTDVYSDGSGISPLNYAGLAAMLSGQTSYSVTIDTDLDAPYWLVYYTAESDSTSANDVFAEYDWTDEYSLTYYPYSGRDLSLEGSEYEALELAYRSHVYEYYLQLPDSTRARLLEIAAENGISASSLTLIDDIKNLVQNYREYDMNFMYGSDYAVDFFEDAKGAICQHFATAATAMYRAFGIPARYTVGFAAKTQKGYRVGVTALQAHAWVEVYIDGMGWVPVEVTGGGPGGGSGGSEGDEEIPETPELFEQVLTVKPEDMIEPFQKYQTLSHSQVIVDVDGATILSNLLEKGYRYEAVVDGYLDGIGECEAIIQSFVLYDPLGNDVTRNYKLVFDTGVMKLTNEVIVKIELSYKSKVYDGTPISYKASDWWGYTLENAPEGVEVRFDIASVAAITDVGRVLDEELFKHVSVWYDGQEITSSCEIQFDPYRLEVKPRQLKIVAASDVKLYDGKPLTDDGVSILEGSLLPGHRLITFVKGSITDPGKEENEIVGYCILDANGNDVTNNYDISCENGLLVVEED